MDTHPQLGEASTSERRFSRRDFLKISGMLTAVLALPMHYATKIARALSTTTRLPVVWLEFQDCTGDTESLLRAGARSDPLDPGITDPAITDLLLDFISLD